MPAAGLGGQRRRVGPGRAGRALRAPAGHLDRDEPGVGQHRVDLLGPEPVVVRQVGPGRHPERGAALGDQRAQALVIARLAAEQLGRDGPFGQLVDPLPAPALGADHVAEGERPLHRDLRVGPVPPLGGLLRAAQSGGGERALGAELVQHVPVGLRGHLVAPEVAALAVPAAAEGEQRPLLDRQHTGRVRPVLEARPAAPVRRLDGGPPDRAEPRVRDQLVRAGQHRDRVQLDGAQVPEHPAHPGPAVRRPEQALCAQGDPAGLVGGESRDGHGWQRRPGH